MDWRIPARTLLQRFLQLAVMTVSLGTTRPAFGYLEINAFYTSDTLNNGSATTSTRMFLDGAIGFAVDKSRNFLVGWGYSQHSTSDATSTSTTYTATQMGPRFAWHMGKDGGWIIGLGYYLNTSATYSAGGGTSELWKGTALKADIGYGSAISANFEFVIRFNYSSAAYSEKLVNSTDYTKVSYSRALIYPSLGFLYLF